MAPVRALGIEVDDATVDRWVSLLMPEEQPFVVPAEVADSLGVEVDWERLTPELRDSFHLYGQLAGELVWLTRAQVRRLPAEVRTAQSHRTGWPSGDGERDRLRAIRQVENGRPPSAHSRLPASVWRGCARLVPLARSLAGAFPPGSDPNCFGAVLAACGDADSALDQVVREPFEAWLASRTTSGGADDAVGTVYVWREHGAVSHAAVTLGGGWAFHKPSQSWTCPWMVVDAA